MAILLNSAGASAADPILKGLGLEVIVGASSMDIATFDNIWIDQAAGFPGTNSVKASLTPDPTAIFIAGTSGVYTHATGQLNIGSTTGLSVGDYVYLSKPGAITAGLYKIASIPSAGIITFASNPFTANATSVAFQVAYRFQGIAGTTAGVSSPVGQINYFKTQVRDAAGNIAQFADTNYIADQPTGATLISIGGRAYAGQTINTLTPALAILTNWANRGGVGAVALASHGTQGVNNFTFGDDSTGEKSLSAAIASGLKLNGVDGVKYGRILLKSKLGSPTTIAVDIDITLDTTAPNVVFDLRAN